MEKGREERGENEGERKRERKEEGKERETAGREKRVVVGTEKSRKEGKLLTQVLYLAKYPSRIEDPGMVVHFYNLNT